MTDDTDAALTAMKPMLGFYIGGMGAKDMNFHKNVFARMGYEKEADEIQRLFFEGKRDEAIAAVPVEAVADITLVGPPAQIRDQLPRMGGGGRHHPRHRGPLARRDAYGGRGRPGLRVRPLP